MKKILIILTISLIIIPQAINAMDQRCFTQKECVALRKKILPGLGGKDASGGFVPAEEKIDILKACGQAVTGDGQKIGFCLPSGKTITSISFGGKKEFENIGEFIKHSYHYTVIVGGVLAVVLIMISGVQWIISGGSAEKITSARKRLTNALIGLLLLVMSYTILNMINPNLVNFRLPQVWLINERVAPSTFCADMSKKKFAHAGEAGELKTDAQKTEAISKITGYTIKFNPKDRQSSKASNPKAVPACNNEYFVEKSGTQTCLGTMCAQGYICRPSESESNRGKYDCANGDMLITVAHGVAIIEELLHPVMGGDWEYPWISSGAASATELHGACNDGSNFEVNTKETLKNKEENQSQKSILKFKENPRNVAINECDSLEELKGFYLEVEVNANWAADNETHYIGKKGADLGFSATLGVHSFFPLESTEIKGHLLSLEDIEKGATLHLNMAMVTRITGTDESLESRQREAYGYLGYKPES